MTESWSLLLANVASCLLVLDEFRDFYLERPSQHATWTGILYMVEYHPMYVRAIHIIPIVSDLVGPKTKKHALHYHRASRLPMCTIRMKTSSRFYVGQHTPYMYVHRTHSRISTAGALS